MPELVYPFRRGEVLEAVLSQVSELAVDELGRGRGDQHLSAVAGCGDAGSAMDVFADVSLLRHEGRTGVQAGPHLDRPRSKRLRHRFRGGERARCRGEGEEERVALRVTLHAVVCGAGFANHPPVLGKRLRIRLGAQLVQQLRRALDVREEEGDGPGRKIGPHKRHHAPKQGPRHGRRL